MVKVYYTEIDDAIAAARARRKAPPYGHYAVRRDPRNLARMTVGRAGKNSIKSVIWSTKNDDADRFVPHSRAVLELEDIPNIAALYADGMSYAEKGRKYDVTGEAISHAIRGISWDKTDKRPTAGDDWRKTDMSSTHGVVIAGECYPTPEASVRVLLEKINIRPTDNFLEPCRGVDRAIYDLVPLREEQKHWAELSEGRDYLEVPFAEASMDLIITNPPFSLTAEFLAKSLRELKPDGTLIYLQRVNFLGSIKRVDFWAENGLPNKFSVLVPRPRFVLSGNDSTEYAWFIYDRGNRMPNVPEGMSLMIDVAAVEADRQRKERARQRKEARCESKRD